MAGFAVFLFFIACSEGQIPTENSDPLPSWNESTSKSAIVDFVKTITDKEGPDYIPEADRIAVFDNDGTLWSEQPAYFQLAPQKGVLTATKGDPW